MLDALIASAAGPGAECNDEEDFARYASGELAEAAAERLEQHATRCPRCAAELELARAFRDPTRAAGVDPQDVDAIATRLSRPPLRIASLEARRRGAQSGAPTRWWGTLRLAAMLAVVLGIGVLSQRLGQAPPVLPSPTATPVRSSTVLGLEPRGEVAVAPTTLEFGELEGAASYRIRLSVATGEVLLDTTVSRPPLALPESVAERLAGGVRVRWGVEALDASGSVLGRSALIELWVRQGETPAPPPR